MRASEYIQIDADLWIVMREDPRHPKAVIKKVAAWGGGDQYFLMTWHPIPSDRKVVRMHDSLEEAARSVKWAQNRPKVPGMPTHAKQPSGHAAMKSTDS